MQVSGPLADCMRLPAEFRNPSIVLSLCGGLFIGGPKLLVMVAFLRTFYEMIEYDLARLDYINFDFIIASHFLLALVVWRCNSGTAVLGAVSLTALLGGLFIYCPPTLNVVRVGVGVAAASSVANCLIVFRGHKSLRRASAHAGSVEPSWDRCALNTWIQSDAEQKLGVPDLPWGVRRCSGTKLRAEEAIFGLP